MKVVDDFYQPRVQRKEVPGYGGAYEVDSRGRVYSRGFEMSLIDGKYVNLSREGSFQRCKVAYMVARAFIPNAEMRPFVRHRDGDTSNNCVENLEWCEEKERVKAKRGETRARRVMCVTKDGDVFEFDSVTKAAEEMMVSRPGILACIAGRQKRCGGFKWYEI